MRNCSFWLCNDPLLTTSSHDHTYIHTYKQVSVWSRIVVFQECIMIWHCRQACNRVLIVCSAAKTWTSAHLFTVKKSRLPRTLKSTYLLSLFPCSPVSLSRILLLPSETELNWFKIVRVFLFLGFRGPSPPPPRPSTNTSLTPTSPQPLPYHTSAPTLQSPVNTLGWNKIGSMTSWSLRRFATSLRTNL